MKEMDGHLTKSRKRKDYGAMEDSAGTSPRNTNESEPLFFQGSVVKLGPPEYKYESLNYVTCDNAIYRKHCNNMIAKDENLKEYNQIRWIITFFIGFLTALVAFLIDIATEHMFQLKFMILGKYITRCEADGCGWIPLLLSVTINTALVAIAASICLIEPISAGSGIPEVKTYLNGIKVAHIVRLKTLACKAIGVMFSVGGGLPCGKEGPMIHCGSVIAAGISQGKSTSIPFFNLHYDMFRNDRAKRDFVSSGAAAGVSASFGAPIGGVMFALEEGASFWNQQLTWRSFFSAMVATFTLNLLLSASRSQWGDLSAPGLISFGSFSSNCSPDDTNCDSLSWGVADLAFFLIIGTIGGLMGALFNSVNEKITIFRMKYLLKRHPTLRILEAMCVSAIVTMTMFVASRYLGHCLPIAENDTVSAIGYNRGYYCKDGEWNDMATLTYNTPETAIKMLFHTADDFSIPTLSYFFAFYYVLACCTYGLGVPSGIFVPALLCGACFGRISSVVLRQVLDHLHIDHQIHHAAYTLIGAAAFLGGIVRMTISLTVILIETTNNVVFGLPIMMTLMVSKWVGDLFNEGLYMVHIELRHIPFLDWEPRPEMKGFYAAQVMTKDVICIEKMERVGDIVHLLRTNNHSAFPVVDRDYRPVPYEHGVAANIQGLVLGIILRSQLVILLKHHIWGRKDGDDVDAPILEYKEFTNEYPRYPTLDQIHVPDEALGYWMDMMPYMNASPYTIQQILPLPRVFNLFRTMGLRHLPVVDRLNQLVGLITRKDLCNLEYCYSKDPDIEVRGNGSGRVHDYSRNESSGGYSHRRSKDFLIAEGDLHSLRSYTMSPPVSRINSITSPLPVDINTNEASRPPHGVLLMPPDE